MANILIIDDNKAASAFLRRNRNDCGYFLLIQPF